MSTHVSIVIDKRRSKKNNDRKPLFPVRLRVYDSVLKKDKRFKLDIDLTEEDYQRIFYPKENERLSRDLKEIKIKLNKYESDAEDVLRELETFTFDSFERKYFRDRNAVQNIITHYNEKISRLKSAGKIGTADSYSCSLNSLKKFVESRSKKIEALRFVEINKEWLENYESYMLKEGKSKTTIGIYLRPLSHLFNAAIELKNISRDYYPFGKNKYVIPRGGSTKKALNQSQLNILFHSEPQIPQQEKAKDFWFLSYALNGMNIHDIAILKFKNLHHDRIEFIREKPKDTNRGSKTITTFLNDYSNHVIKKYHRKNGKEDDYVFNILEKEMTPEQIKSKVKIFTRFINQHVKNLAEQNNLPSEISTYWARHTFATMSVNKGASLEFMSEALGHSDLKTTQTYFAGFTNETKKQFAQSLFDF
ncbi:MAG TPA: integrase [Bacteroidales bacterium]|jgi:integrase/recombinase XerD|nr:integrase [Bacteroidales bacterium]